MERNGFNPSSFETSGDKPDDSKESTKSKKKKTGESAVGQQADSKKEVIADRTKSLLEKFLGEHTDSKVAKESADKPATLGKENGESPEDAEENTAAAEIAGEDGPSLEELSPAEDAEITRSLVEDKLAELEAGRDENETPDEVAGREAAIAMLEQMRDETFDSESETAEIASPTDAETGPEVPIKAHDAPEELDDEQTVALSKATSPKQSTSDSGGGNSRPARGGNISPAKPNHLLIPTAEKTEHTPDYRVNPNASYVLAGGIVGYLIGRRRGRIKTEKRLGVVQKKLEKQVEAKQQEINEKTETVRKLASQNYVERKQAGLVSEQRAAQRETTKPFTERFESTPQSLRLSRQETPPIKTADFKGERPGPIAERRVTGPERSIELSDSDIARLSETITIGDTNLRKIHEARLITDGGLRRLVNEHLQGKDIRRGLAREFLTKELSYERDPHFRDIVPLEAKGARSQSGGSTSTAATDQPVALVPSQQPTTTNSRPTDQPPTPKNKRSNVSTGVLSALSLVALALAAYAVWLGMSR